MTERYDLCALNYTNPTIQLRLLDTVLPLGAISLCTSGPNLSNLVNPPITHTSCPHVITMIESQACAYLAHNTYHPIYPLPFRRCGIVITRPSQPRSA